MENKTIYVVCENVHECHDTRTLKLTLEDGTLPVYSAGQFITVYFPELQKHEGKAYTFSSAPHESTCNITVKNIGEFSGRLCSLQPGDRITASLPYGFFSSEYPDDELILLAGGIGITPFRSIVLDTLQKNSSRKIRIFHSIKYSNEKVFSREFQDIGNTYPNVQIDYHLTQEAPNHDGQDISGRIDPRQIVSMLDNKDRKEYLLCGSIAFVRDLWKGLKELGVDENTMYTEAFFR